LSTLYNFPRNVTLYFFLQIKIKLLVLIFCCCCCFIINIFITITITITKFLASHFVYSNHSSLLQAINHANRNWKLLRRKKETFQVLTCCNWRNGNVDEYGKGRQIKTERLSPNPSSRNQTMKTKTNKTQLFPLTNYFRRCSTIGLLSN